MKKYIVIFLCLLLLTGMLCGCDLIEKIQDRGYKIGVTSPDGWYSSWIGLQYKPSGSMRMANDQKLEEMLGKENANRIAEMGAESQSGNSILVWVEQVPENQTVNQYLDTIKSDLRDGEASVRYSSTTSQNVGGIRFSRLDATFTFKHTYIDFICKTTYLVAKKEDRMIVISCFYANSETADPLLSGFSAYND